MSTMYVNKVQELNVGSGVHVPGHIIQVAYDLKTIGNTNHDADIQNFSINTGTAGNFDSAVIIQSLNITPKYANSKIILEWTGQIRTNMSSGGGGMQAFFGKNGQNLLTSGGNYNSVMFRYNATQLSDQYQTEAARWIFTAGQTSQMTLDLRASCYNANTTIQLSHDGTSVLTAKEIAV